MRRGRGILITGGSRGIGLACAREFHANGDDVVITYNQTPPPPEIASVYCDVTRSSDVESAVAFAVSRAPIEVVVANAGEVVASPTLVLSDDGFAQSFEVNVFGVFRVIRCVIRPMVRARQGRIVIVSSVAALMGVSGAAAYASAKAALVGLTRSLARELGPFGITVNAVLPGAIGTGMTLDRADWQNRVVSDVPLGRLGHAEEVASLVRFLASEEAAYITGTLIPVDGGLSMGT
jgi:Dehydrogenases with different specificities (related to short-chain alcohol dehydrogenases)